MEFFGKQFEDSGEGQQKCFQGSVYITCKQNCYLALSSIVRLMITGPVRAVLERLVYGEDDPQDIYKEQVSRQFQNLYF